MNTRTVVLSVAGVTALVAVVVGLSVGLTGGSDESPPEPDVSTENCLYNACQATQPDKLNIHIVAHSHDDAGWLYTVDKYFNDRVYWAINTMVIELEQNPDRQYIQVEIAFFERWWRNQSEELKARVRNLVSNGQLQFALGHWSMPDEAVTYYSDLITNAEVGMRFLEHEFGRCGQPLVGWQIDPFGHSVGVQKLYQKMGYDGWFLGRIDYEDYRRRNANGEMEFEWNGFWTSINANVYRRPEDFCWDSICDGNRYNERGDEFIIDDAELDGYNVEERVDSFLAYVEEHAKTPGYTTNHVMLTMGDDFFYTNADKFFVNLDKLIKYINQLRGDKYHAVYSTPTCYMHAAKEAKQTNWPSYSRDFFPYCDGNFKPWVEPTGADLHGYWSGYYASRNQLKIAIRSNSSLLHSCNQWETMGLIQSGQSKWLRRTIGLTQHHDAVTGTEKQKVVDDYNRRLAWSADDCLSAFSKSYNDSASTDKVVVYNSLAWPRNNEIILPTGENLGVHDLPPLGMIELDLNSIKSNSKNVNVTEGAIENGALKVSVTNDMITVEDKATNNVNSFAHSWMYYDSCNDNSCGHNSGAYIFVPKSETPNSTGNFTCQSIDIGTMDCRSESIDYISYKLRVSEAEELKTQLIIDYTLGPLPVDQLRQLGKEVFARFEFQDQFEDSVLYTDANMFDYIDRNRSDIRPLEPTASRYMPITAQAQLKFSDGNQFEITTDRAAGVTSLEPQQFDIMLHRRTLKDDGKGLGEAMNDDTVIQGSLYINFDNNDAFASKRLEKFVTYKPVIAYKSSTDNQITGDSMIEMTTQGATQFASLKQDFPPELHLLTLERDSYDSSQMIVRVENLSSQDLEWNLEGTFNFVDEVKKVTQVNLAGILDENSLEVTGQQVTVSKNDIVTLRIEF